jgi:hypothetical protein
MRKCKYCGKEIYKVSNLMGIWSDSGAHIFCDNGYGQRPHYPLSGSEVVSKVLEKYGQEL